MQDLSKCKYIDGNLYCWDRDQKDFVLADTKDIASQAVYKNIVAAFMEEKIENK